jgi:hypothetical protein
MLRVNGTAENETHSVAMLYFALSVTVLMNEITHYLRFKSHRLFKFSNDLNRLNCATCKAKERQPRVKWSLITQLHLVPSVQMRVDLYL